MSDNITQASKIVRYGKSFRDIMGLKKSFFENNLEHLSRNLEINKLYTEQPARERCKVCDGVLSQESTIEKQHVCYTLCNRCGQLNGTHQDTEEFCNAVYSNNDGRGYAKEYSATDIEHYERRCEAIYKPKAEFLIEVLESYGEDYARLSYTDMGAGSGYFIKALRDLGVKDVKGYEVGLEQVRLGNFMNKADVIKRIKTTDTPQIARENKSKVVSFIGVFEHLQDLRLTLQSVRDNEHTRYIYMCVPLVSPTVFNEAVFQGVMPRHLSAGHTHLFSEKSINYFCNEYGLEIIGEWWFGTDMMDYYRSVSVELKHNQPDVCLNLWEELFEELIDKLQLVLDERKVSSQVHMVLRKVE
jgi:hypothetical protein